VKEITYKTNGEVRMDFYAFRKFPVHRIMDTIRENSKARRLRVKTANGAVKEFA